MMKGRSTSAEIVAHQFTGYLSSNVCSPIRNFNNLRDLAPRYKQNLLAFVLLPES